MSDLGDYAQGDRNTADRLNPKLNALVETEDLEAIHNEVFYDHVASGGVWSYDGSAFAASMTAGIVYIDGVRLTLAAVVSRSFTASKDTYVDVYDNGDGTAAILYTEVANGATPPSLSTSYVRIAMLVTSGSVVTTIFGLAPRGVDELGRCKLIYGTSETLDRPNLAEKKYLTITTSLINSGTILPALRFNADSGSNYSHRASESGGADSTATSQAQNIISAAGNIPLYSYIIVTNITAQEKISSHFTRATSVAGAGTAPYRREGSGKWANTSAAISRVQCIDTTTGIFTLESEVIIKGHD